MSRETPMLRLDLHIHTRFSKDSEAPIASVIEHCQSGNLDVIAITDHDNIRGAMEVRKGAPFQVIIGEEIKSTKGDIIGLFLEEEIPGGLSPQETVNRIKDQGGLVVVPHPFCRLRPTALGGRTLLDILTSVDVLEGYNSHTIWPRDNAKGAAFALEHELPMVASSDSHSALELGSTYTEVPLESLDGTPEGLMRALRMGRMVGKHPNPFLLMAPGYARLRKVLT
jgi:predicted metal-dependent phosphoesterase TrpH